MLRNGFAALALWGIAGAGPAAAGPFCTAADGQQHIDAGRLDAAVREFSCVIDAAPTEVEGYRGRIEAQLLLRRYSDAVRDYARVTAFVLPAHPDAATTILSGYGDRLGADPANVPALTGASFAHWWFFKYASAIQVLNDLLAVQPDDPYATLFRGSSRMLGGNNHAGGAADLEHAITLAPASPDVRFIVADAYTYGQPDAERALAEASLALAWGLDTPRVHAMLAAAHNTFGHEATAAWHTQRHISLVTTELVLTAPIAAGGTMTVPMAPGRVHEIPMTVAGGEAVAVRTRTNDYFDTILVLLAPNGTPVLGADDFQGYMAGFDWIAPAAGTYRLRATSFEAVATGGLKITRR